MCIRDRQSKQNPSARVMIPAGSPFANIRIRTAASTASGISIHVVDLLIPIGTNKAVTPRIAMMLNMLLPRTLPNASAELPSIDEMIFTTSSGVEVPKATTVRPVSYTHLGMVMGTVAIRMIFGLTTAA